MRRHKKILVSLLVLAFVLWTTSAAFAFSDTSGTKYDTPANRLASLNILKGYEDGSFKPDKPITRAEFAAVAVRALGLENAATYAKGATIFPDVAADHWASGYINVAVDQGIIKGYPDGTFKPEAQVTYAESLAMIVRSLGYEPTLKGSWPTKYLIKAAELDISKGVNVSADAPALRGDVAVFVDNSLDVPKVIQVGFGDEAKYVVSGTEGTKEQTLLGNNLGMTQVKGVVTDASVLLGSGLAAGKIEVTYNEGWEIDNKDTGVYKLTDDVDPASLVGLEISAWANDDDEIFMVTDVENDDVKAAYLPAVVEDAGDYTAQLGKYDDYKEYEIAGDARVYLNYEQATAGDVLDYLDTDLSGVVDVAEAKVNDDYVKANYLVKDREIVYLNVVGYKDASILEEVNTKSERILAKFGGSVTYGDKDLFITRDGKPASLEDLKENDVFYSWSDDDRVIVTAFSQTVSGTLESAATNWSSVTVDDKSYTLIPKADIALSDDEGDTFGADVDTLDDYLGEDVTLHLGFDGKVVGISGTPEAKETATYGLVYGVGSKEDAFGNDTVYVGLYNDAGKKVDFEVTKKTKFQGDTINDYDNKDVVEPLVANTDNDIVWTAPEPDETLYLVKYTLTSDNKLSTIERVGIAGVAVLTPDDTNDRISFGGTKSTVKSGTKIFSIKTDDPSVLSWETIEEATSLNGVVYASAGEAKVIIVTAGAWTSGLDLGIVTGNSLVAGERKLTVDVNGESKSFQFDEMDVDNEVYSESNWGEKDVDGNWNNFKSGNLVRIDVGSDGELLEVDELLAEGAGTGANGVGTVASVSASDKKLTIGADTYWGTEDTVVYDCTGSAPEYVDFSAIRKGDTVQIFLEGADLVAVKIVKINSVTKTIMGDTNGDQTAAAPVAAELVVTMNPPGTADTVSGNAGAVEGGALVEVWNGADPATATLIGSATANADGSFAAISIGNNAYATVWVTAKDAAGNRSAATAVSNDIAAPTGQTVASATYVSATNTLTLTGTNFETTGTVNVTKVTIDSQGDGATTANVTLAAGDVQSITVDSATQITIVLTAAAATNLESQAWFNDTTADKLDLATGWFVDAAGNASTDAAITGVTLTES